MFTRVSFLVGMVVMLLLLLYPSASAHANVRYEFANDPIGLAGAAPLSPAGTTGAGVNIVWAFQQAAANINATAPSI